MTRARDLADRVNESAGGANKNLIINGHMALFQRATSASVSSDTYSTVDRFKTRVRGGAAYTISRSTDVPSEQGFNYSLKFDNTTADASPSGTDFTLLEQRMEGVNLQQLLKGTASSKKLTLSFHIKSNVTGTYIASLYDNDNDRRISKAYTIDSVNTWEKKEITFDGDTTGTLGNDTNEGMRVQFWFSAGSTYQSGTLNTTWAASTPANVAPGISNLSSSTSNELYITGIQLEIGEKATDFEFESYPKVLEKCQRYYFRPSNGSYGWNGRRGGGRLVRVNNRTQGTIEFPTTMRANPSLSATRSYGDGIWSSGTISANNGWTSPFSRNFINIESNVNVNSGSGNGGTFGFSIKISAEL